MQIDPFVQEGVGGTNGRLYVPVIGKLRRYPIPPFPMPPMAGGLLLDIGCGWGRWMLSSAWSGFLPIGIDVRVEAAQAALRVLAQHGQRGYTVVADLGRLPFADATFDAAFSYSVLQHTHRDRARACVRGVREVLVPGGTAMIEFPLKKGLANMLLSPWRQDVDENDWESWDVRYYTEDELAMLYHEVFGNFACEIDCYFGIGVQATDLDILPWRYKAIPIASELLKDLARHVPGLSGIADSVYAIGRRSGSTPVGTSTSRLGSSGTNLDVVPLLVCPVTRTPLEHDAARNELVSKAAGLAYAIHGDVPDMVPERARKL